jgi:hypothetical protein
MALVSAPRCAVTETSGTSISPEQVSVPKAEFNDLIVVLNDLRLAGIARPQFSVVLDLLLARKPDAHQFAGVPQFRTYIELAEDMRIVTIEHGKDDDSWISLCRPWHDGGSLSTSPRAEVQQVSHEGVITKPPLQAMFQDLIFVLSELRTSGEVEPRLSTVVLRLLTKKPTAYETRATNFKDCIEAAVKGGIITVRQDRTNGDAWVTLCDDWSVQSDECLASRPEPPRSPPNPPPTDTLSSAFHPLINVLEDFRTRGCTQPPVSEVFSKLYWSGRSDVYRLTGASTFTDYLIAAVTAGIITIGGGSVSNPAASVCLRNREDMVTAVSKSDNTTARATPSAFSFEDLTHILEELYQEEANEFSFSDVKPLVLARNPQAFEQAGVSTFNEYVQLAAQVGVVIATDFGRVDDGWIKLRGEPVSPQQPLTTQTTPLDNDAQVSATFRDLVLVLQQLRTSGKNEFQFVNVAPLLLKRNPNVYQSVGAKRFTDYIELAANAGIVSVRGLMSGNGWISLCDSRPGNNRTNNASAPPPQTSRSSSDETVTPPPIPSMYRELVWLLRQRRSAGDSQPLFSAIAPVFMKNPSLLARSFGPVRATRFKQYAECARDAGMVKLDCSRVGGERMSLCPAWEEASFVPLEDW